MRTLTSLVFLLFSVTAFAQNYDCLQFGPKNYFINGNGYVRGIRIDSVNASGGDTIYFPYRTRRISNYLSGTPAIDTFGASWLGKKVIKQSDGTFLFDNLWDTVVIKTQAHLGDSWMFFNDTTNLSYTATITYEGTMSVLGVVDSVKKITITADSAGVAHTSDPVNNFQIILSKNHGFAQVFDLYTFPYHRPDSIIVDLYGAHYLRWFDYYLDVLLNNLGTCDVSICTDNQPDTTNSIFQLFAFHDPTRMEIYDFAIGDVYESQFSANNFFEYTLDSVTSKVITPYNVAYGGTEHRMDWTFTHPGPPVVTYPSASFSLSGGDTSLLIPSSLMPEEWDAGFLLHFFPHRLQSHSCDSPASYEIDDDYMGRGFADNGAASIPSYSSKTYSIGYGMSGMTRFVAPDVSYGQYYTFYYKDTIACGTFINTTPLTVTSVNVNNIIHISPNPAINQITITTDATFGNNTSISVYNITGKCIFCTQAEIQNTLTINTSSWTEGLYMVIIQNNEGIIKKEKIIINH